MIFSITRDLALHRFPESAQDIRRHLVVKLFQTSEAAWETYLNAIAIAHSPIYNSFVGGSGTIGFNTRFHIDMLLSQMQYLGHAVKFVKGGTPEYPAPIDFTRSEDTPQAAEERNNRPG